MKNNDYNYQRIIAAQKFVNDYVSGKKQINFIVNPCTNHITEWVKAIILKAPKKLKRFVKVIFATGNFTDNGVFNIPLINECMNAEFNKDLIITNKSKQLYARVILSNRIKYCFVIYYNDKENNDYIFKVYNQRDNWKYEFNDKFTAIAFSTPDIKEAKEYLLDCEACDKRVYIED